MFKLVGGLVGALVGLFVAIAFFTESGKTIDPVAELEHKCRQLSEGSALPPEREVFYINCVASGKVALNNHGIDTKKSSAKCKVIDPDIASEYVGDCLNGLAQGAGTARARDEYSGHFNKGEPNGQGTYIWGPPSEWSGDKYIGKWTNGERSGKGTYYSKDGSRYEGEFLRGLANGYGSSKTPRNAYVESQRSTLGSWRGDYFLEQGLFENGKLVKACESQAKCPKPEKAK